jgi:microspherule protein 1
MFEMKTKMVLVGRATKDCQVDMDLSEEGPAHHVSRRHAIINLKRDGDFYIKNIGARSFDVNGKSVRKEKSTRLNHDSVLSICGMNFLFEVNTQMHAKIKRQLKPREQVAVRKRRASESGTPRASTSDSVKHEQGGD